MNQEFYPSPGVRKIRIYFSRVARIIGPSAGTLRQVNRMENFRSLQIGHSKLAGTPIIRVSLPRLLLMVRLQFRRSKTPGMMLRKPGQTKINLLMTRISLQRPRRNPRFRHFRYQRPQSGWKGRLPLHLASGEESFP